MVPVEGDDVAVDCGCTWDAIKDNDEVTNAEGREDDGSDVFLDVLQHAERLSGTSKFQVGV